MKSIESILELLDLPVARRDARIYFTQKNRHGYSSYSPVVDTNLMVEIIAIVRNDLSRYLEVSEVDYNPIGCKDDTFETCSTSYIGKFSEITDSFNEDIVCRELTGDNVDADYNFYCIKIKAEIETESHTIYVFRRLTRFKRFETGFLGYIAGNHFVKMKESLIGIDSHVDLLVYNNTILILQHIALERIFDIFDEFIRKAKITLSTIEKTNAIKNFAAFQEDCLNDKRVTRILTKMSSTEASISEVFSDFDKIEKVISIFDLNIKIDEIEDKGVKTKQLDYDGKENILDVVRIIGDSYYQSLIRNRNVVEDGL